MNNTDPANVPQIDNLWSFIAPSFKKHKKKIAWLVREGKKEKRKVSYNDLEKAALTIAALLRAEGVGVGDTVGVTAPNGPEWTAATLAGWKVGAMVAPIHIGNSEAEIKAQVEAIKPKAMLGFNTIQLTDNQHLISLAADEDAVRAEREIA
ncbi:MAG: AMP-binding protein, partial [Proteobacteria bacterium]|nr:AMP-binding protein [Pseudomonadota bacterium]